jgi:hypothetical protein
MYSKFINVRAKTECTRDDERCALICNFVDFIQTEIKTSLFFCGFHVSLILINLIFVWIVVISTLSFYGFICMDFNLPYPRSSPREDLIRNHLYGSDSESFVYKILTYLILEVSHDKI